MTSSRTLFDIKVREQSGAETSARYQFQANVAIVKLCELHEADQNDYEILVDQFDDLVTITGKSLNKVYDFYQVKGKASGNWTIGAITKADPKAKAPNSIVGKLYQNAVEFGVKTGTINFLSNAGFKAKMGDGSGIPASTKKICVKQLHVDEKDKIDACLSADFPSPRNPDCSEILFLEKTAMGLSEQQTFVIGRLNIMLAKIGYETSFPIQAFYQTLFAEISAKAAAGGTYANDNDLIAAKAIKRSDVDKTLTRAMAEPRFNELWPAIPPELSAAGWPTIKVLRFHRHCLRYLAQRSVGQFDASKMSNAIQRQIADIPISVLEAAGLMEKAFSIAATLSIGLDRPSEEILHAAVVELLEKYHADGT